MTANPRVSILMPAYNTAGYIRRAIQSALAQTVDALEVLVIDDGSTDGTYEIAEELSAIDDRVRVFKQKQGGPSPARNRAMEVARGQYFALLDSDDEWAPEFLQHQLGYLDAHPDVGAVTVNVWNRGGPADGLPYWPRTAGMERLSALDIIEHEDSVSIMTVYRRGIFETVGGFDESQWGSEDYEFWLRAALAGFIFVRSYQPLGWCQRRPESMSAGSHLMLKAIVRVLGKTRRGCLDRPQELEAIDRQIARFECELLEFEAKLALRAGQFGTAAAHFRELYRRRGGTRLACVSAVSRLAPQQLLWIDGVRRALRRMVA